MTLAVQVPLPDAGTNVKLSGPMSPPAPAAKPPASANVTVNAVTGVDRSAMPRTDTDGRVRSGARTVTDADATVRLCEPVPNA